LVCFQIKQLLEHAANPAAYNSSRKTPFDLACEYGHEQVSYCCANYLCRLKFNYQYEVLLDADCVSGT